MTSARTAPVEPLGYGTPDAGFDVRYYLEERYATRTRAVASLTAYYRLKPLLPRPVQIALRRVHARRARRRHEMPDGFPRWPIEPLLVEQRDAHLRARLERAGADRVPLVALWPGARRFAFILTHDVEGARGLGRIQPLLEIERRHGMVSSWNLVGEDYTTPGAILDAIGAAGGEVGLHGLRHDGRLFEDRLRFESQLPGIHARLRAWGAEGFRSPATHRNPDWMPELGCRYDSSFPDTDPFEPQPGGCCSILPYFIGDVVELPITLTQDHTMFEILRERDISLWRTKAAWIARHGGLITVLVHPDYMGSPDRLRRYDELLAFLSGLEDGWHALPRDVARWWRQRDTYERALERGEACDAAPLAWARERDGEIVIERGDTA